jgi:hypothetical protein
LFKLIAVRMLRFAVLAACLVSSLSYQILYVPLDNRFATRGYFLSLAKTTPFTVTTPPSELIPGRNAKSTPTNFTALFAFLEANLKSADVAVISAEMMLYGGLVASRVSNETQLVVQSRLQQFVDLLKQHPSVKIYVSTTVMRIPHNNAQPPNIEDPWFWVRWGSTIYNYSYFTDKYQQTKDAQAQAAATRAHALIPPSILENWLRRRSRNHNITKLLLQEQERAMFQFMPVTQDDSARYGFNVQEARELKSTVRGSQVLNQTVKVYPGADEVGLTLLARLAVRKQSQGVRVALIWRDANATTRIPNFESDPVIQTVQNQLDTAGGTLVPFFNGYKNSHDGGPSNGGDGGPGNGGGDANDRQCPDVLLLINNFSEERQLRADQQPPVSGAGSGTTPAEDFDKPFQQVSQRLCQRLYAQYLKAYSF